MAPSVLPTSSANLFVPLNDQDFLLVDPSRHKGWQLRLPLVLSFDDGAMLTACPKCHHLFVRHAGGCANSSPTDPMAETAVTVEDNISMPRRCCPSVMTLRVPSCAMNGGSVILQKGSFSRAELKSPEPSPSVPLSFVLPTTPPIWPSMSRPEEFNTTVTLTSRTPVRSGQPLPQSETDLQRLTFTLKSLKTSGWYYEGLSWQESVTLLISTSPGTFLVRDSSDPRYLFSLSVQTERGPTSVRLHYSDGRFRLDAEPKLAPSMPQFDCVVKLVEHYVKATKNSLEHRKNKSKTKDQVWIDSTGQVYSHILLAKPLYQKEKFPTLQHLSRLAINRDRLGVAVFSLPVSLNKYLKEYPYSC